MEAACITAGCSWLLLDLLMPVHPPAAAELASMVIRLIQGILMAKFQWWPSCAVLHEWGYTVHETHVHKALALSS